jgi:V8-like Glu-specific endopeptidase
VLVAPDRVLTATHCLSRDERSAPRDPSRFVFAPGWPWNGPGALFGAADVTLPEARTLLGGALPFDVALVRLDRPVPPLVAEPLPLTEGDGGGGDMASSALTAIAYPNGAPDTPLAERACRIVLEEGDVIGIDCASKPGFSGGAVLAGPAGGWRLRAVIVAQSRRPAPAGAAGAAATYAVRPAENLRRALTEP